MQHLPNPGVMWQFKLDLTAGCSRNILSIRGSFHKRYGVGSRKLHIPACSSLSDQLVPPPSTKEYRRIDGPEQHKLPTHPLIVWIIYPPRSLTQLYFDLIVHYILKKPHIIDKSLDWITTFQNDKPIPPPLHQFYSASSTSFQECSVSGIEDNHMLIRLQAPIFTQ